MAGEDLVLAGVASAILRNAQPKATAPATTPAGSSPTVSFTSEQLDQLAGAVADGVRSAGPAEVSLPPTLSVRFTDEEIARLATALTPAKKDGIKSQIFQRSILIDIGTATVPDSTFVNAEFPSGVKVASFNFSEQAGLIGVTLSASIVNTFTKPAGFFVALASASRLNFDATPYLTNAEVGSAKNPDSQILLSVFTHQNSTPTTINPNTRASAISFGLENAVTIVNSQTTLSLYAFQTVNPATGLGETGQLMSAILTAYYIPLQDTTAGT